METPNDVLQVADHEFGLQKMLVEKTGGVDQRICAYAMKPGAQVEVHQIQFDGDFRDACARLVPRLIERYEVVVSCFESFGAVPVDPETMKPMGEPDGEVVFTKFDTRLGSWIMICPLHRNPDRLERGDLEMPMSVGGRIVDGPAH